MAELMPQAYRVKKVEARTDTGGAPTYRVELAALYYGADEDGPKEGQVLRLEPPDPEPTDG
jgi:hypothetical protein